MSRVFDCSVPAELLAGTRQARTAIAHGELIVMPTDTVYGLAADAFNPDAVQRLLDAKGRGRQQPPPVLIGSLEALDGLADRIPPAIRDVVAECWPGGLTVVLPAQPSLDWDLGETQGTVALRMPDHPIALELLAETGPLAVSSANLTGRPAATSAAEAEAMLGESVAVYLDDPGSGGTEASTIVDATPLVTGTGGVRILRRGAVSHERLAALLGDLLELDAA